jgi:TolB-like protein/Flp pilus assembly protein TadD
MGEVYRARDTRLSRDVAVKVLPKHLSQDARALARFEREARAVAALSHPNILAIYDVGTDQGVSYCVTELLEGETLRAHLERGAIPWRKAAEIGAALADGVAAAHAKGITHRDLKPANIFCTIDGRVKVLDFGLAEFTPTESAGEETVTQAEPQVGTLMGTLGYMSPEQVRGALVGPLSDIFALGCVLYEMISGQGAFTRSSFTETIAAILTEDVPELARAAAPPELERVILRCLEKNPRERFQSARDLASRFREILASPTVGLTFAAVAYKPVDSLAVLPFFNAGGDPDAEYFSEGITETIINTLSELRQLRIAARTTVLRYKGQDADPRRVGRELNVRAVLTGKIVQRGDHVSVQTELVDAADGSQLWGQRYNRKVGEIFAIEEEIAREISEALRLQLSGEDQRRLGKHYTESNQAYQLFLKGRYYWNRRTAEMLKLAVSYFEQAIQQDPEYALAWAGLGDCYALYSAYEVLSPNVSVPRAEEAAWKALEIDNTLAEPHAALGWIMSYYHWDWVGAERQFRRAIELNPNYAVAHYWFHIPLVATGRMDEAWAHARRALEIEPLALGSHIAWGLMLIRAGRYEEAMKFYQKAIELDPNFLLARWGLAFAYEQKGMCAEAVAELQEGVRVSKGSPLMKASLGRAYAVSGQRSDAESILIDLQQESKRRYVPPFDLALIYLGLGDRERSVEWLARSCDDRSFWLVYFNGVAPLFSAIRSDPRYLEILNRLRLFA